MANANRVQSIGDVAVTIAAAIDQNQDMPGMKESIQVMAEVAAAIAAELDKTYGLKTNPEVLPVMKNNGEKYGITFRPDNGVIGPTIYPDSVLKDWNTGDREEITRQMASLINDSIQNAPRIPDLTVEEAKEHITLTLVNTAQNQQMLDKTPHFEVCDGELSAVPRWYIDDHSSFIVNNDMASRLMLTPDEVLQIGLQRVNAQHFDAKPMHEILAEMMGVENIDMIPNMGGPQMIVLSSENKIQGASALLSEEALDHVHEMIGDFCVLPSSIHEVICVPITEDMKPDDMRAMVREVNMGQVAPEERLSDQIFMHDGNKLTMVGESFKIETPTLDGPKIDGQTIRMTL